MEGVGQPYISATFPTGEDLLLKTGYEVKWAPERVWTLRTTEKSTARVGNRTSWTDGDIVVLLSTAIHLQLPQQKGNSLTVERA
jgi:hypothetical protein